MSCLNMELFCVLSYVLHLCTCLGKKKNQNGGWSVLIVNGGVESSEGENPSLICIYIPQNVGHTVGA